MYYRYILLFFLLLGVAPLMAQPVAHKGRVGDAVSKKPLAGATVLVIGTQHQVYTDSMGRFTFFADSSSAQIKVSYAGYGSHQGVMPVGQELLIWLSPLVTTLDTVTVSTGYQLLPKERASGSFVKVDEALVNRAVSTNVLDRLEGVTSGLYVDYQNGQKNLYIRGISTLSSGRTAPLIVVDNFPFEGSLDAINPQDIESVTVLKDAAASSIWGARAGNGVIVINTRKGKYSRKGSFRVALNTTVQQASRLSELPWANSAAFLDAEEWYFTKGAYDALLLNDMDRPLLSPWVEDLAAWRSGRIDAASLAQRKAVYTGRQFLPQVQEQNYRQAVRQQYSMQWQGGSDELNAQVSLGHDRNAAQERGSLYRRSTMMIQLQWKPAKGLELLLSTNQGFTQQEQPVEAGVQQLLPGGGKARYYPYAQLQGENGALLSLEREFRKSYLDTTGAGRLLDWQYRPLEDRSMAMRQNKQWEQWSRMLIRQRLTGSLQAEAVYQLQSGQALFSNTYDAQSFFARHLVNVFSQPMVTGVSRPVPLGGILDESRSHSTTHSGRVQLLYQQRRSDWHWNAVTGLEVRQVRTSGASERRYGYDKQNLGVSAVDFAGVYPSWGNLRFPLAIPNGLSQSATDNRFVSGYFNGSAEWKQRLLLSGSIRRDASNVLGVATNEKGVPLWSAGMSWQAQKDLPWLKRLFNYVKLRASYGYSGNLDPSLSAKATISYRAGSNNVTNLPFAVIQNAPNPSLRWEKVGMTNVGVDFELSREWLSGSIEWYYKKAEDLLSLVPMDPTTGISSMRKNAGQLKGHGWDISLHTKAGHGPLQWQSTLLLQVVKQHISAYAPLFNSVAGWPDNGSAVVKGAGYATYALFSYAWAGLDGADGAPLGLLNNGPTRDYARIVQPTTSDELVYHGTTRAPFFGSWRHSLRFKQWGLSVNIQGQWGHYFRKEGIDYSSFLNNWIAHEDLAKRWRQPGDERVTQVPALYFPIDENRELFYRNSSVHVYRADHVRWQDLRLDYQGNIKAAGGRQLRMELYAYLANLPILWRANPLQIDPLFPSELRPGISCAVGCTLQF